MTGKNGKGCEYDMQSNAFAGEMEATKGVIRVQGVTSITPSFAHHHQQVKSVKRRSVISLTPPEPIVFHHKEPIARKGPKAPKSRQRRPNWVKKKKKKKKGAEKSDVTPKNSPPKQDRCSNGSHQDFCKDPEVMEILAQLKSSIFGIHQNEGAGCTQYSQTGQHNCTRTTSAHDIQAGCVQQQTPQYRGMQGGCQREH